MPEEMRPAYLIAGDDESKIDATRSRLRARAEGEGGSTALEVFEPLEGRGAPSLDALLATLPAMSLVETRRYVLVDGIQRWRDKEHSAVAEALASLPPDLTLVLISRGKSPAKIAKAVEAAGGEVRIFEMPSARNLPGTLVKEAASLGYRLEPDAARLLVTRLGQSRRRLSGEVGRLALWAGEGGEVTLSDLETMIVDESETAAWALSDALLDRDREGAQRIAERLIGQGESVAGLIYALASRLRKAHEALMLIEGGAAPRQVEGRLGMHPYAAKLLVRRLENVSVADVRAATEAVADLELWCRGGADYGDELALTLALDRAA
jgi:DNA polymerase-3 subunit delta